MSKRIYLSEIKRIVKVDNELNVKLLNGDSTYPISYGALATPTGCKMYELRYRQSPNGKLKVRDSEGGFGCKIGEYDKILGEYNLCRSVCFLPKSWKGKRFNRYVKVLS